MGQPSSVSAKSGIDAQLLTVLLDSMGVDCALPDCVAFEL